MKNRLVYTLSAWFCIYIVLSSTGYGQANNQARPVKPSVAEVDSKQATLPKPIRPLPIKHRVLVLNYDPFYQGKRLHQELGFNDPRELAKNYILDMKQATKGLVDFEIVEWRDLDEIYAREDGGIYRVEDYVRMRRTNAGWPKSIVANYPRILSEQKVVPKIDDGTIDEVWIFGDHYFGLWEASMAGPGAFFINGGVYPNVPSLRPFAFYGFNYERGVAEMLHNTAHRVEATMNRTYGNWNLKTPQNNWELFSANFEQSGGIAGVGTCHWPPNAQSDYDYGNKREVLSHAEDFLNYPKLTLKRRPVSAKTWSPDGVDPHRGYMKWYFGHIPQAPGINPDGKLNNWFPYIFDFQNYDNTGKPLFNRSIAVKCQFKSNSFAIMIGFATAAGIDVSKVGIDSAVLTVGKKSLSPTRIYYPAKDLGTYRTVSYVFSDLPAEDAKSVSFAIKPDQIEALDGSRFPQQSWRIVSTETDWEALPMIEGRDTPKGAARWIVESGGKVGLLGTDMLIEDVSKFPDEAEWIVDRISFWKDGNPKAVPLVWSDMTSFEVFSQLRSLELTGHPIGDRGCDALTRLPLLRSLNVHACGITDQGLATLSKLSQIERLDIGYSGGKISDSGAIALLKMPNLKWLNIYASSITDQTLLNVFSKLPNLEYVEITSTATTAAGIEKLKAAKPSLTIIHHNLGGD
jgi:hypothetical protein